MSLSAFGDKAVIPNDDAVAEILGEKNILWNDLRKHTSSYKEMNEEWKFYSKAAGWSLVVRSGKRTLFYFIPMNGHFTLNFVFGMKAIEEALNSDIPAHVKKAITDATQYVEGTSFKMDVNNNNDIGTAVKLIDIKNRN